MVLFPHNTLETVISFENLPQLQFPPKKSNPIEREREMADVEETELSGKQKKEIAKWFLLNSPAGEIQYVAKGNAPLSLSLSLSLSLNSVLSFFFFLKKKIELELYTGSSTISDSNLLFFAFSAFFFFFSFVID
jgi:sensor domain CHASE-containing protein